MSDIQLNKLKFNNISYTFKTGILFIFANSFNLIDSHF